MFDVIRKREFFRWWERGYCDKNTWNLKCIQDGWALSMLRESEGLKIGEVGGGIPRVLPKLAGNNECWNIDKLEGDGNGPTHTPTSIDITHVDAYLGDFDPRLPDDTFDVVFSLSVLEHVSDERFHDCFRDMARILKPGGRMLHAIDVYLPDRPQEIPRIELYRHAAEAAGTNLRWLKPPNIPEQIRFRTVFACNADQQLANWNRLSPSIREDRETCMSCSIKAVWVKPMV